MAKRWILKIIYCISLIVIITGRWFSWDIVYNLNSVAAGTIFFCLEIIYIIFLIAATIGAVHICSNKRTKRCVILLSCLCFAAAYGLGNTEPNVRLNYHINKGVREEIIQMMNNGDIERYRGGANKYMSPYRRASQTNKIHYWDNGNLKALFTVNSDLTGRSVIIYVSDDSGINENDFGLEYRRTGKLDDKWYYGIAK